MPAADGRDVQSALVPADFFSTADTDTAHDVASLPVAESRYVDFVASLSRGTPERPGGVRGAVRRFSHNVVKVGRPPTPADKFPDKVDYCTGCGSLCAEVVPEVVLKYQAKLHEAFVRVAGACEKKAADVGKVGYLFMFEISLGVGGDMLDVLDGADDTVIKYAFVLLSAASAQHGRHPAKQIWTFCDVMQEVDVATRLADELAGLRLRLGRESFIEHEAGPLTHPFSQQEQGSLRQSVHDEFSAWLIKCLQGSLDAKDLVCPTVIIQRLKYDTITGDVLQVLKFDEAFASVLVAPDAPAGAAGPAVAAPPMLALMDGPAIPDFADIFDEESDLREDTGVAGVVDGIVGPLHALLGLDEEDDLEDLREVAEVCLAAEQPDSDEEEDVVATVAPPAPGEARPPPRRPLAQCDEVVDPASHQSPEDYAQSIGLEWRANFSFVNAASKNPVGYMRVLPSGSVKATCAAHPRCSWFLNTNGDYGKTSRVLLQWLRDGETHDCSSHCDLRCGPRPL